MSSDRNSRKQALAAAQERLAKRRKGREMLEELRKQKNSGAEFTKNDYGKKLIEQTKSWIDDLSKKPKAPETQLAAKDNVPGPRVDLMVSNEINAVEILSKVIVEYEKKIQTDALEIAQCSENITDTTTEKQIEEILKCYFENDVNPWPPKNIPTNQDQAQNNNVANNNNADNNNNANNNNNQNTNATDEKKNNEANANIEEKKEEPVLMTEEEAIKLTRDKEFVDSFKVKTKWMERALGINEEYSIFYEVDDYQQENENDDQLEKIILKTKFSVPEVNERSIVSLDFSSYNKDWLLAAHSKPINETLDVADGCINIWNITNNKLESTFMSQSMIMVAKFHGSDPNLLLAATVSGQILGWDIRAKQTPIIRTQLSSGHSAPVFGMHYIPISISMPTNPNKAKPIKNIVTISNDGKFCIWRDDVLVDPLNEMLIRKKLDDVNENKPKSEELVTTCLSVNSRDANTFIVGSDDARLYKLQINMNDTLSHNEQELFPFEKIDAHDGPITNVQFHPFSKGKHAPLLYLTSSYDWTVKLWHYKANSPLAVFSQMQDYCYDVQWSPTRASVFACGDGLGKLTLFDLNSDFESPIAEPTQVTQNSSSITRLCWQQEGKYLAIGDSNGEIYLYDIHPTLYETSDNDFEKFESKLARVIHSL